MTRQKAARLRLHAQEWLRQHQVAVGNIKKMRKDMEDVLGRLAGRDPEAGRRDADEISEPEPGVIHHVDARDDQSAAEVALDEIVAACGGYKWEYPGQVVRDVLHTIRTKDEQIDELTRDVRVAREVNAMRCAASALPDEWCEWPLSDELLAAAHRKAVDIYGPRVAAGLFQEGAPLQAISELSIEARPMPDEATMLKWAEESWDERQAHVPGMAAAVVERTLAWERARKKPAMDAILDELARLNRLVGSLQDKLAAAHDHEREVASAVGIGYAPDKVEDLDDTRSVVLTAVHDAIDSARDFGADASKAIAELDGLHAGIEKVRSAMHLLGRSSPGKLADLADVLDAGSDDADEYESGDGMSTGFSGHDRDERHSPADIRDRYDMDWVAGAIGAATIAYPPRVGPHTKEAFIAHHEAYTSGSEAYRQGADFVSAAVEAAVARQSAKLLPPSSGKVHELKCWAHLFDAVESGNKTFDLRKEDDRSYQGGDTLVLRRCNPEPPHELWTRLGRGDPPATLKMRVTYVMRGPRFGLLEGWVCMALAREPEDASQEHAQR